MNITHTMYSIATKQSWTQPLLCSVQWQWHHAHCTMKHWQQATLPCALPSVFLKTSNCVSVLKNARLLIQFEDAVNKVTFPVGKWGPSFYSSSVVGVMSTVLGSVTIKLGSIMARLMTVFFVFLKLGLCLKHHRDTQTPHTSTQLQISSQNVQALKEQNM